MKSVKVRQDESYWERACHFFRTSGGADSAGSYLLHNKNGKTVKIGIMCKQVAVSIDDGHFSYVEDGQRAVASPQSDGPTFKRVERLWNRDAPCFFLVSPDIRRRFVDKSLPQILLMQPALELSFSPAQSDGQISYAQDVTSEQQGAAMLRAATEKRTSMEVPVSMEKRTSTEKPLSVESTLADQPHDSDEPRSFSELAAGWVPAEADESFLTRLATAINVLQDYPDGKLTLTRAYERRLAAKYCPFTLYELHARTNGDYACSHFVHVREGVVSLGTSPENVFEINDGTVTVDVVAGTCKSNDSYDYVAQELYENPKQIKEHKSSLLNRQNRVRAFCKEGSIRVAQDMQIKVLRNVCHLHSVFTGELLPDVTIFDLLENIFPLLGARPKELLAIADVEAAPHRFYGGVVGYLYRDRGGCFLNIRNVLLDNDVIHAKVGTGVIRESDSYNELLETRNKLSGVLEAVHRWEQSGPGDCGSDS